MKTFAQKKRRSLSLWAFGFSSILISSCKSKEASLPPKDEQCVEKSNLINASLRAMASGCPNAKKTTVYAHYIQQTRSETVCFEDVINSQSGEVRCSPGPFLTENHVPDEKAKWSLSSTPDYFVWHLSSDSTQQDIYMTNQNGFPIKSQVVYLKNQQDADEATLVLLPLVGLDEGSTYYLYLTLNQNNQKQTWIQPLSISKALAQVP